MEKKIRKEIQTCNIVKLISYVNLIEKDWVWREASGFWMFKSPEGFYYERYGDTLYRTIDDFSNDEQYFIKEDKVYYKPHLTIFTNDQRQVTRWFETKEELDTFRQLILVEPWVEI
jgi:hypothetical protein